MTAEFEKFGIVSALAQLVNRENLTDDILVVVGDKPISFDTADFLDSLQANEDPTLAAYDVDSYKHATKYGLVELNDNKEVVDFQKKPEEPNNTLVSIACDGFTAGTLSKIDEYLTADNNPDAPGRFIQWLQQPETVHTYTFEEAWFDIGTPESYLDAAAWHLDGENYVHPTATINSAQIGENVQIMANVTIENSVIFPEATI